MDNKVVPNKNIKAINNKSLSNKAADILRDMIIKGECPLGSRITETDFAEALGVSRICIREAFLILENEGLVRRVANKYTEISMFYKNDIEEMYRLRTAIEIACLETGMEKKLIDCNKMRKQVDVINGIALTGTQKNIMEWVKEDLNFHELIILQSGNLRALKVWNSLKNQIKTLLYTTLQSYPDSIIFEKTNSHKTLIEYIENGSFERAAQTLKDHIMNGCYDVMSSVNS